MLHMTASDEDVGSQVTGHVKEAKMGGSRLQPCHENANMNVTPTPTSALAGGVLWQHSPGSASETPHAG